MGISTRLRLNTGAEVAIAAAAVTAAAGAASAGAAIYAGQQQQKAAEAQAKAVQEQARRDAMDAARSNAAQASRQRALLSVMGADLTGQGLALLETTAEVGAIGQSRIASDASSRVAGLRASGEAARTQGYLNATGSVLQSIGSAGSMYAAGRK